MTADRLVRLYPRAWRERYGAEFLETVGPQPLHPQQVIDIAMGAVDAWLSADVRRSSAGVVAGGTQRGGSMMTWSKIVRSDSTYRMTAKDGMISAAVVLAGTLVMTVAGTMFRKSGYPEVGESIMSVSFTIPMMISMPFSFLKGQPWRAQALLVGLPIAILLGIGWLNFGS